VLTIDGEGGRQGHADEDAALGGSATDDIARRDDQSYGTAFVGYRSRRVNPQMGQVATSVVGSTTRKLVQPLVLQ